MDKDWEDYLEMPTSAVSVNENGVVISHNFANAFVREFYVDKERYATILIKGYGYESEIGKPQLPGYTDIIPLEDDTAKLNVSLSDYVEYSGLKIIPAQCDEYNNVTNGCGLKIDSTVYNQNIFFPRDIVTLQGIQDYRGKKYAFIRVNPIQYNPVSGNIRCYQNIQYCINNVDKNFIEKKVRENNDSLYFYSKQEKYIIVTSDNLLYSIEDFVQWKKNLGYHVSVLSKDQWANDIEVKDSIRAEYYRDTTFYNPRFLLIVGENSEVPAKLVLSDNVFSSPHYVTDHYFACMGDSSDCIEDIARGRIIIYNPDSIKSFLQFVINQEKNPSYYKKGIHSAYFNSNNYTMEHLNCVCFSEEARDYMMRHDFQIDRVYAKGNQTNPLRYSTLYANGDSVPIELRVENFAWDGSKDDIRNALCEGCDYIMYKGHGTKDGLYQIGFNRYLLPNINNICSPIFLCFACLCGQFAALYSSGEAYNETCFADQLIYYKKACCVVASSGNCSAPYIEPFGEAFFSSMYLDSILSPQLGLPPSLFPYYQLHEINNKRHTEIGEMLKFGYEKMFQSFGLTQGTIKETTHMHVFGDPSYNFPTNPPRDLDSIDVYRCNDSIYIELNGISPCTIIFIKEDDNGNVLEYKRIEDLTCDCQYFDNIDHCCPLKIAKRSLK